MRTDGGGGTKGKSSKEQEIGSTTHVFPIYIHTKLLSKSQIPMDFYWFEILEEVHSAINHPESMRNELGVTQLI